jgi:bacillolysin
MECRRPSHALQAPPDIASAICCALSAQSHAGVPRGGSCTVHGLVPRTAARGRDLDRRGAAGPLSGLLVLALLAAGAPAEAAEPGRQRPARDGWAAQRLAAATILPRDRALARQLPDRARIAYHPETRRVRLISGTSTAPLSGPAGATGQRDRLSASAATAAARRFIDRYADLFGVADPARELRVMGDRTRLAAVSFSRGAAGRASTSVRFQQQRDGVPVLGGEIVVQLGAMGEVISAAGEALPSGARVRTRARLGSRAARRIAALWLARETGRSPSLVRARSEGLALHDPRILGGQERLKPGARLVWRIDARVAGRGGAPLEHRLVLVDAMGGQVDEAIARVAHVNRQVCDFRNRPRRDHRCRKPFTRTEKQAATGIRDVDAAHRLMGVVDAFFRTRFGRDGLDDRGARMRATVRYCPIACPWNNAMWDWASQQAAFGNRWVVDDIVGHEFAHGVLDHEARLFYHYQSGAINEALADIFGELIDQAHPEGRDTAFTAWKIGEDLPIGVLRDMRDPPRFGHPDRVRSPLWHTSTSDNGGVHRNSGVANKAAYLIAAGGTFRGYTIAGLGRERMGRIFYWAMSTRLTSAADYLDLNDALLGACTDLAGNHGITLASCASVEQATRATQMHLRPTAAAPRTAPVCRNGIRPVHAFHDDLEDPASGLWRRVRFAGTVRSWYYPPNPNNDPTWDGTWASSGELNLYGADRPRRSDSAMQLKAPVVVPERGFLHFEHGYSFDKGRQRYDGGIVEIRVGSGPWRSVNALFTHGGYNGSLATGTGNPQGGRRAFTGESRGWGSSRVDLSSFAGQPLRVRFRLATDRSGGGFGWYIDDVRIYTCVRDSDVPTGSLAIDDGATTTSSAMVTLGITASDATTWVSTLRLSNSGQMDGKRLAQGLNLAFGGSVAWDLTAAVYGGGPAAGQKTVYAQVRDAAGNWSAVFSDSIDYQPGG